jgi:hypothetical protein
MDATEKLAQMMIRCGLATGHGDTIDDLIFELEKQIKNTSHAFSDALKEIELLRKALKKICHVTGSDMEAYDIAENALKGGE